MALECFDGGGILDHLSPVSEAGRERARSNACVLMSDLGCSPGEITEVLHMLGLYPEDAS